MTNKNLMIQRMSTNNAGNSHYWTVVGDTLTISQVII
jgi:hypothetical protein